MENPENEVDTFFDVPFLSMSIGSPDTGKTGFLVECLLYYFDVSEIFSKIYIISPNISRTLRMFILYCDMSDNQIKHVNGLDETLVRHFYKNCLKRGPESPHILVIIDDMSGSELIHNNRTFAAICNTYKNRNISICVIAQQPLTVATAVRANATLTFAHRLQTQQETEKLIRIITIGPPTSTYKSLSLSFRVIVELIGILLPFWIPLVIRRTRTKETLIQIGHGSPFQLTGWLMTEEIQNYLASELIEILDSRETEFD